MITQTTLMLLVGGMFFGMIASQITESLFRNAAATLNPETRERMYQYEMKWDLVIRIFDIVSFGVLICGVVKMMGRFPAITAPNIHWGGYAMAAGNILGALSLMLQGWVRYSAYQAVEDAKPSRPQARTAFMAVVVFELIWVGLIVFLVYTRFQPLIGPVSNPPAATTTQTGPSGSTSNTGSSAEPSSPDSPEAKLWIDQSEALKILGQDAEYLEMLVKLKEVKAKKNEDGTYLYFYNHLDSLKQSGLPKKSELNT